MNATDEGRAPGGTADAGQTGPADAAHAVARWVLTWAVRGRGGRGTDWGEGMLRELDEVDGGRQALRWAASGAWTAWRERVRRLPESRLLGGLPRPMRIAVDLAATFVVAAACLALVNQFALTVGYVPSGSMEPTLRIEDRVLVDRVSFHVTGLHYGDIVLFSQSYDPMGPKVVFKRVVGLPGDVMSCGRGRLVRNGAAVDETYLPAGTSTVGFPAHGTDQWGLPGCAPVTVPDGDIYVLGDHRDVSLDSREYGPVSEKSVLGRALTTVWSGN
jgi:signal peptidase I